MTHFPPLRGLPCAIVLGVVLACAGCSLNPQPLPPEQPGSSEDASATQGTPSDGGGADVPAHGGPDASLGAFDSGGPPMGIGDASPDAGALDDGGTPDASEGDAAKDASPIDASPGDATADANDDGGG